MTTWQDHIDDSAGHKPFFKATGKPIASVLEELTYGNSIDDILARNTDLNADILRACFAYAHAFIANSANRTRNLHSEKVHVGRQDLMKAFQRHANMGKSASQTDSGFLLLVYAVECGLKYLLLTKRGLHSTDRLDHDDLSHDLNQLLKSVGGSPCFDSIMLQRGSNEHIDIKKLHQVLRYGVRIRPSDRDKTLELVTGIIDWLHEAI